MLSTRLATNDSVLPNNEHNVFTGESINSLNILTEESTSPPSEPTENQVWSSSIEQQNAANRAHSPRAKSDVISDDISETDSCENMMSRGNSRPTSTIIEGPIDFRRLSSGSREGKGAIFVG